MDFRKIIVGLAATGVALSGLTAGVAGPANAAPSLAVVHNAPAAAVTASYPKYLLPKAEVAETASFKDGTIVLEDVSRSKGTAMAYYSGQDFMGDNQVAAVGYGPFSSSSWKGGIASIKKKYHAKTVSFTSDEWVGTFVKNDQRAYVAIVHTVRGNHIAMAMIIQSTSADTSSLKYSTSALALAQSNYMYDMGL